MREQVLLAQRIAFARTQRVRWAEIAKAENMAERTLRYHLARWKADLKRERESVEVLLQICQARAEEQPQPAR